MNSEQYKEAFAAIVPDEKLIQRTLDAAKPKKNLSPFRAAGLAVAAVCLAAVLCVPWIPKAGRSILPSDSTMSQAQAEMLYSHITPLESEEEIRTAEAYSQISDNAISEAPSHTVSYNVITPPMSSQAQPASSAESGAYVPQPSVLPGLQINELSGSVGADRLYFPPETYDTAVWSFEQFIDHWGRSIRPSSLPKDLTESQPRHAGEVVLTKQGELAYDAYHFTFAESFDESYDPLRRRVTLSVSALGMAKDALYPLEHPVFSQLNGVEVMFGHCSMPYGPYDPDTHAPAGQSDVYVAEFTCGGVEHQLITENLTLEEAQKILLSLL